MSAINVIVKGDSAHIITDGAAYADDGAVLYACSKVMHASHINAAIAVRGPRMALPLIGTMLAAASTFHECGPMPAAWSKISAAPSMTF